MERRPLQPTGELAGRWSGGLGRSVHVLYLYVIVRLGDGGAVNGLLKIVQRM